MTGSSRRSLRERAGLLALLAGAAYAVALALLVQLAAPPPGTATAEPPPPPAASPSGPLTRAAHYFAGEWSMNFWSADLARLDEDLARLKADGFDSVVLVVPWGELQPGLDPIRYDPFPWARLRLLLRAADRQGVGVIARIGYTWDFAPGVEQTRGERFTALFVDATVQRAWSDYVRRLATALGHSPAFRFALLTWEDFWGPVFVAEDLPPPAERARMARETGFVRWLRGRSSLEEASRRLGRPLRSWADVRLPGRREPAFRLFLDYMDRMLVERVYRPARAVLPRLSFEARIDDDPLWAGGRDPASWYEHGVTFRLPGAPFASTYYAPSIGALNVRDQEPAARVLERMDGVLADAVRDAGAPVFLDQFLFFDNTPKYRANTQVRSAELGAFVRCSAPVLRRHTRGYAVWAARDFPVNGLYNPSFVRGLRGWTASGTVAARPQAQGGFAARLGPGSRIGQLLPPMRNPHWAAADGLTVELRARAAGTVRAAVTATVEGAGSARAVVGPRGRSLRLRLPHRPPPYRFSLSASGSSVELDDVRLFSFVHRGSVRGRDGRPGPALAAVRDLNAALAGAGPGETVDACLSRRGP